VKPSDYFPFLTPVLRVGDSITIECKNDEIRISGAESKGTVVSAIESEIHAMMSKIHDLRTIRDFLESSDAQF
jgi:hypothetical protein